MAPALIDKIQFWLMIIGLICLYVGLFTEAPYLSCLGVIFVMLGGQKVK